MSLILDSEFERTLECSTCNVKFTVRVLARADHTIGRQKDKDFIASISNCPHCGAATVEDVE